MFKHSEYNLKETEKFIKLTKEAFESDEKFQEWNGIRAMYGIYPERDKGTYMLRPRFPGGELSLSEFSDFVEICEKFGDRRVHITTRQDIQVHGLNPKNLVKLIVLLFEKGYSSRATGGNAARAVIVPPMSGFEDEVFDVTPYSELITNHILADNTFMGLPRKYKIALSNKEKNATHVKISDLGFLAVEANGKQGFKVYGAGGLGASSKESLVLCDFVPKDEILYHVEAVKNLFAAHGDRANKARARIRYIAQRFGDQEFKNLYNEYLEKIYKVRRFKVEVAEPVKTYDEGQEIKTIPNLLPSNIKGLYGYYLHPFAGDIPTELGRELVETLKALDYKIELRLTYSQGLVIRGLKGESIEGLKPLFDKFSQNDLEKSITCVGKSICNLGILESPLLFEAILEHFEDKKELEKFLPTLRISGCPNSCGGQQIGALGFWGKKKNGEEYYTLMAKGDFTGETLVLNQTIGEIKATQIPQFLEDLARTLNDNNKTFEEYLEENPLFLEELMEKYKD